MVLLNAITLTLIISSESNKIYIYIYIFSLLNCTITAKLTILFLRSNRVYDASRKHTHTHTLEWMERIKFMMKNTEWKHRTVLIMAQKEFPLTFYKCEPNLSLFFIASFFSLSLLLSLPFTPPFLLSSNWICLSIVWLNLKPNENFFKKNAFDWPNYGDLSALNAFDNR